MTAPIAPPAAPAAPAHPRGRGLVIAGAILIGVSLLGGTIGSALTLGRIDFGAMDRDVVFGDGDTADVPGDLPFTVDEPLPGTDEDSMTVGVGVRSAAEPDPTCTMETAAGEPVQLMHSAFDAELFRDGDYSVVGSARLSPGDYVARCEVRGEPSATSATFTVGRTLGSDDLDDMIGPLLAFLAVGAIGLLMFVVGAVLLIVGIVLQRRDRRGRPPGPQPTIQWGPPPGS